MLFVIGFALFFLLWVTFNVAASGKALNEAMRSRFEEHTVR